MRKEIVCLVGGALLFLLAISTKAQNYPKEPSGTLPVLYLNTEGNQEIVSKDNYLNAEWWFDSKQIDGIESIGSESLPQKLQIKGRGNWSWAWFEKKPFRIKLEKKESFCGLKANKNYCLLANADDTLAYLRNTVGFEMSKRIGLKWTPQQVPIELMINGDYRGLYFLTEKINVGKDRVSIEEQKDGEKAPESITGGWLLEIDQYKDPQQIEITEGNGKSLKFTYHTPDSLSEEQEKYLYDIVSKMDAAIYEADKTSTLWEELIDLETLVKFYIVQEIMDNTESFHGSCYLYKDRGDKEKFYFGPVWDFGICYDEVIDNNFIYDDPPYGQSWIGEIAKYPRFQAQVKKTWLDFEKRGCLEIDDFIDSFITQISLAAQLDYERWPMYASDWRLKERSKDLQYEVNLFKKYIHEKIWWLKSVWSENYTGVDKIDVETNSKISKGVYSIDGKILPSIRKGRINIQNGKKYIIN